MNVLVINLTRFGDLLQSQPLMSGLHAAGHRTGLMCLDTFAAAVPMLRDVDYTAEFPAATVVSTMQKDWRMGFSGMCGLVGQILDEFRPDLIINTTATNGARYLVSLLCQRGASFVGYGADKTGEPDNVGLWSGVLLSSVKQRMSGVFNIADMFRMLGRVGEGAGRNELRLPQREAFEKADALLAEQKAGRAGYVALQLGASSEKRRWPAENFAELGTFLHDRLGIVPVLVGTKNERHLLNQYAAHTAAPFVDAMGRTDIPTLAALLTRTRLLCTNDTGTMHLAAGFGVPSLALFFATAQPWDTGPYLSDCCCLEPDMPCHPCEFSAVCPNGGACLQRIPVNAVCALVQAKLVHGAWKTVDVSVLSGVRAWITGHDAEGLVDLSPLTGHETESRTRVRRRQRYFIRHIIDGLENAAARDLPVPAFTADAEAAAQVRTARESLERVLVQGKVLLKAPAAADGRRFLDACADAGAAIYEGRETAAAGIIWESLCRERGDSLPKILSAAVELRASLAVWERCLSPVSE